MIYIKNDVKDPYFNLALEEYVLTKLDPGEDYCLLWQNKPSIIIGKYQNTLEEINREYVKKNNINVVRRLSGGGAVYHDLGNVNYTFIIKYKDPELLDFKKFTIPVIRTLDELGIKAELSGRNDITINGKKICGNAQHVNKGRLLHHGSLLFDSELDKLQKALNVKGDKIKSKGIKSVRNRVTNISDHLEQKISVKQFISLLKKQMEEYSNTEFIEYTLSREDIEQINRLRNNKYVTWEWNYGESPPFNYKNSKRFSGGKVEVRLNVKKGIIEKCKIYGDFLGTSDIRNFEKQIEGLKYDEEEIKLILEKINVKKYFGSITREEIFSCIIGD